MVTRKIPFYSLYMDDDNKITWEDVEKQKNEERIVDLAPRSFFKVLSGASSNTSSEDELSHGIMNQSEQRKSRKHETSLSGSIGFLLEDDLVDSSQSAEGFTTKSNDVLDSQYTQSEKVEADGSRLSSLVKPKGPKAFVSLAGKRRSELDHSSASVGSNTDPNLYKDKLPEDLKLLGSQHPLRILVADDNPIVLKTISKQLAILGYTNDTAENGLKVLDLLNIGKVYDVILMDLHMPEMGGLECTRKIVQKLEKTRRPTIIAVTSSQSEEESLQCIFSGFAYYLAKPISIMELTSILSKCIRLPEDVTKKDAPKSEQKAKLTRKKSF